MSRLEQLARKRVQAIATEAHSIAGTAGRIAAACDEVLAHGGQLSIAPQATFLTGAIARLTKDLGVVEHFNAESVVLRKPLPTR